MAREPRAARPEGAARALCAQTWARALFPAEAGVRVMGHTAELSRTKRQLLEKLLRGEVACTGAVTPRRRGVPVPISAEQRNVWAHAGMAPEVALYNEPITIHRRGSFDLGVLERSLNEILRRHEI